MTMIAVAVVAVVLLVVVIATAAGAGLEALLLGGDVAPSTAAAAISPAMLGLYEQAAATCPGLPWTVLAAIGTIESDNGTSTLPGVHSGANSAGAEGPMQFEPATFAAYDEPVPPGGADPPSPYDAVDAVYAAARMLCSNGGLNGADLPSAVFAYNHDSTYVSEVLTLAAQYGRGVFPEGSLVHPGSAQGRNRQNFPRFAARGSVQERIRGEDSERFRCGEEVIRSEGCGRREATSFRRPSQIA
jgi:hypothetical protein